MDFSVSIDTPCKKYPGKHYDHQQSQKQFVATRFIPKLAQFWTVSYDMSAFW